jgi:valyl-tRNA synthetase
MDISPGKPLPVLLQDASDADQSRATTYAHLLARVGRVESITVLDADQQPPASATALLGDMRLLVPMKGVIDVDAERSRLQKQREKLQIELTRGRGKLENANFVNNAPVDVVAKERQRAAELEKTIAQLAEQIVKLDELA